MSKQLGKGLSELFADNSYLKDVDDEEKLIEIPIQKLIPNPHQPRKKFDDEQLAELAASIKAHGVFTPIIATFNGFKYVIVAGERRYRASKLAGMTTIPAIVRDYSEREMMEVALLENIQRQDLTSVEIAQSYKSIIEKLGITQEEFATSIGKSRSQVTNLLGILVLPSIVLDMINNKQISYGHARVLSKITPESRVIELANKVYENKLSVRHLEELAIQEKKKKEVKRTAEKQFLTYEKSLKSYIKNAKITGNKIVINFEDEEELARIIKQITG